VSSGLDRMTLLLFLFTADRGLHLSEGGLIDTSSCVKIEMEMAVTAKKGRN
jgi:hypothetical protein